MKLPATKVFGTSITEQAASNTLKVVIEKRHQSKPLSTQERTRRQHFRDRSRGSASLSRLKRSSPYKILRFQEASKQDIQIVHCENLL